MDYILPKNAASIKPRAVQTVRPRVQIPGPRPFLYSKSTISEVAWSQLNTAVSQFPAEQRSRGGITVLVVGQCEIAGQRPVPTQRPKSADAQGRTVRPRVQIPGPPTISQYSESAMPEVVSRQLQAAGSQNFAEQWKLDGVTQGGASGFRTRSNQPRARCPSAWFRSLSMFTAAATKARWLNAWG
jgi:hypothetical protein